MKRFRRSSVLARVVLYCLGASVLMAAFPHHVFAQVNPNRFGTRKLNVAKSKSSPGPAPKSLTRTDERAGDGAKATIEGTAGDGSRIAYSYTAKYDGNDYPFTGVGTPNGADTLAIKRIDDYTNDVTLKKGGKVVASGRSAISQDGKVMTVTLKGTNQAGQPTNSVTVYEKQ